MNERNNSKLTRNAQGLRKNMTKEERHLWYDFLKLQTVTFNRQKVIGKYIADFIVRKRNWSLSWMAHNIIWMRDSNRTKNEMRILHRWD